MKIPAQTGELWILLLQMMNLKSNLTLSAPLGDLTRPHPWKCGSWDHWGTQIPLACSGDNFRKVWGECLISSGFLPEVSQVRYFRYIPMGEEMSLYKAVIWPGIRIGWGWGWGVWRSDSQSVVCSDRFWIIIRKRGDFRLYVVRSSVFIIFCTSGVDFTLIESVLLICVINFITQIRTTIFKTAK